MQRVDESRAEPIRRCGFSINDKCKWSGIDFQWKVAWLLWRSSHEILFFGAGDRWEEKKPICTLMLPLWWASIHTQQRITRSDKEKLLSLSLIVFEVTLPPCAQISGRMTDDYRAAEHRRWKATLTHERMYSYAAFTCDHPQLPSPTRKPILTQPAHTNITHTCRQNVDLCNF